LADQTVYTYGRSTGGSTPYTVGSLDSIGTEEIVSQCHKGQWPAPADSQSDVGGAMSLKRTFTHQRFGSPVTWSNSNTKVKRGTLVYAGNQTGWNISLDAALADNAVLNAYGSTAVRTVLPTNPASSMAQAVAELRRDGLPKLPGSQLKDRVKLARDAGGEYLNVEFGWLPLLADLQDFARAVKSSRQIIEQYVRDSDHKIRRRHSVPMVSDTRVTYGGGFVSPILANWACQSNVTERLTTELWFSGAFRYHVPVDTGFMNRLFRYESLVNHLFGTRITPSLLWELTPWSWAIDWFTNVGDVLQNVSLLGVDGLVMQYGYAMRRQTSTAEMRQTTIASSSTQGGLYCGKTIVKEVKQRVRANPYGFGITDSSLSVRQLAILSALGLTQGRRTL
jgi:hypothetical protein